MASEHPVKPLIPFGWLRTIIFLGVYLALMTLLGKLQLDFYSRYTLICIASLAWMVAASLLIDRHPFSALGFQWRGFEIHAAVGFSMAIAILGTGTCLLVALGQLNWMDVQFNGQSFFLAVGTMLLVALAEEAVFRGYVLRNLMQSTAAIPALFTSAALFAIFHGANPNVGWLPLVNVFIAGLLLGINYLFTKNLWFGIALHFAWNFVQGPVLGFSVSGLEIPSLLTQSIGKNNLLTGGGFGFEGSLINTMLCCIAILVLALDYRKK
jgi:membrane protease YdiL (CAAX protease family)